MPKNFGGQWIEVSKLGKWRDSANNERNIDRDFINQVIANFTPNDAPVVVGHPELNAPAFGWTTAIRLNGDSVEAQFADVDDDFEQLVREGKYRKRSASFYLNPPRLRHVGFLGAMPPAIKGLREIQFNDGNQLTVEISFSEEKMEENKNEEKMTFSEWFKKIFGGTQQPAQNPAPAAASFSEADAKKLVDDAVKQATEKLTTEFNEKHTALENTNKSLLEKVGTISTNGKRSEIASFVESIPAEKGKHFLKRAGIAEFMESLADADAKDAEKAVVCFSEEADGKKQEVKMSRVEWFKNYVDAQQNFVSFGESFGAIKASAEADALVDPDRKKRINAELGLDSGGAK